MVKRKGYESRKKLWNYIWLNPKCTTAMDNQQVSSEQEKPQRLFSLREVGHKLLVPEVVRP